MKQTIVVILFGMLMLAGCGINTCYDGRGEDSYYPSSSESYEQYQLATPQSIVDSRIAYVTIKNCHWDELHYFVKKDSEFKEVKPAEFEKFITEQNSTCGGCLNSYSSGY